MSAAAVDLVDASWRLFQTKEKPLTPRGRSRLAGHRRTRDHEKLEKHDGSPKHSGRRFVALARATMCDLTDGVSEFFEVNTEQPGRPPRPVIGYSRNRQRWEKLRRRDDIREIDARHRVILDGIADEFRAKARILMGHNPQEELVALIASLEAELSEAHSLAEIESINNRLEKAGLALVLTQIDLQVLSQYDTAA